MKGQNQLLVPPYQACLHPQACLSPLKPVPTFSSWSSWLWGRSHLLRPPPVRLRCHWRRPGSQGPGLKGAERPLGTGDGGERHPEENLPLVGALFFLFFFCGAASPGSGVRVSLLFLPSSVSSSRATTTEEKLKAQRREGHRCGHVVHQPHLHLLLEPPFSASSSCSSLWAS